MAIFAALLPLIPLALVAYAVYIYIDRKQQYELRSKLGLRGPEQSLLWGNDQDLNEGRTRHGGHLFGLLNEWRQEYGETFGYYVGRQLTVISFDEQIIKAVLVKNFGNFSERLRALLSKNSITSKGLINNGGKHWKFLRSILSPIFSTGKLKQMSPAIVDITETMMKDFENHATKGDVFDIYDSFQALTLDVIGKLAFALQSNCQQDRNDPFFVNCRAFFNSINPNKMKLVRILMFFPELTVFLSKFRNMTGMGKIQDRILGGLRQVLEARKQNYKNFQGVDILQLMLKQKEEMELSPDLSKQEFTLDDDTILANSLTFLLAGYETTSTALGYTAWVLATHPQVQTKLQREIDAKLTENPDVNYGSIQDMPYLDAVFKESLRRYPPVPGFVFRLCTEDCEVAGQKFAKGVRFMAPVYNLHHDPEVWDDPTEFRPERFLEGRDYPAMAWLPFGVGPRNCIGMRFADMEYKIALVKTLSNFSIKLPENAPKELCVDSNGALMRPVDGVKVKLEKR